MYKMVAVIIILAIGIIGTTVLLIERSKNNNDSKDLKISFKQALELTDLPIITLYQGSTKYNMLVDTGSNASYIEKTLVHKLEHTKSEVSKTIISSTSIEEDISTIDAEFTYKDHTLEVSLAVFDLKEAFSRIKKESGVQLHGILGTDVCTKYRYIIDFKDCLIYTKK